jgi:hypothetical protein
VGGKRENESPEAGGNLDNDKAMESLEREKTKKRLNTIVEK